MQKLHRLGFIDVRQSGSHLLIRHFSNPQRYAIIPIHSRRTIPPGTLKHILDSAQVTKVKYRLRPCGINFSQRAWVS
ncbi:type II toxin-antitoxin system HicA family toxin [Sulfobacillus harzensis]|uniref:type II toxin-antitoxin system HicA family toxin n=1 Tax=Sulfobacillus harzensis TaxID=2729629 RepID=UPI001A9AA9F3